jgi:predicted nucleotidyltransferase
MEDIITNNYYFVLGEIEKSPKHVREISRKVGLSHTQTGKIVDYFYNKGILEKTSVGKSIVYEIKKSRLAMNYLIICNELKLIDLFSKDKKIKIIFEEIFKIEGIFRFVDSLILFGSYAKGIAKSSSDIDLFFVSDKDLKKIKKDLSEIGERNGVKINIKSLKKEEFYQSREHPLSREILQGIALINPEMFYNFKWQR